MMNKLVFSAAAILISAAAQAGSIKFDGFSVFEGRYSSSNSSPKAIDLWKFITNKAKQDGNEQNLDKQHDGSEFAEIGPDEYLVIMEFGDIYVAEPRRNALELVTSVRGADSIVDPLTFHSLPQGASWSLVHTAGLTQGEQWEGFGALFINLPGLGHKDAKYFDLAGFEKSDDVGSPTEPPCGAPGDVADNAKERGNDPPETQQNVESFGIRDVNKDGLDDVVISVLEQNCESMKLRQLRYIFLNTGHSFSAANISNEATP